MKVTPTQNLLLEVLAARYRLGENLWTFESRHAHQLEKLADLELVDVLSGVTEGTIRAMLTEKGREEVLSDNYTPPQQQGKEEFAVQSRSRAGGPWDQLDTGLNSKHSRPYTREEAEEEVRTGEYLMAGYSRLVHRVVPDWEPVSPPILSPRSTPERRFAKTSYGDLLTVGMTVDRIDHFKTNGRIVVISTVRRPTVLVRWPGLEDEWIEADMLTPHASYS